MKTICIMCPIGCPLDVTDEDGSIKVVGNACKRGYAYGVSEYTNPLRNVQTLARTIGGEYVSVKTSAPVAKNRVRDIASHIKTIVVPDGVKPGDVIEENSLGLGADIVVTGVK